PLMEDVTVRVRAAFGRLDHFIDGYLAGEGGQTLVVQVYPPGAATSLDDDQRLFAAVSGVVRALDPPSFHPSIRVGYGGEVRGVIENQENLVRDLLVSSILVLTAVASVLVLYYRSWRSIPLLVLPLFTGVAATFAVSRWVIHYLNPNTAFLGSIIVGNGINAGIILLARYFEERRRGSSLEQALPCALQTTWVATFAASAAAAASYGSLRQVGSRQGRSGGAAYWESHVDAVLQSYQTPTVVLTDSPEKAQAVAAAIEEVRVAQMPRGTIDSVATLQKLVPDQQPRKIE